MPSQSNFLELLDWPGLLSFLVTILAILFCFVLHELSHGLAAYRLGDPTAKDRGRLTLNPLRHIDPLGFVSMLVAGVGWAKPVPVDLRYFKHPKRDMAVTALAGPASNLLTAVVSLGICSLFYHLGLTGNVVVWCVFGFLCKVAILSVGMGLFNLLPIPPMDGSRIVFSILPDRVYYQLMRYERYIMVILLLLMFLGVFSAPLSFCINGLLGLLCRGFDLPPEALVRGSYFIEFLFMNLR